MSFITIFASETDTDTAEFYVEAMRRLVLEQGQWREPVLSVFDEVRDLFVDLTELRRQRRPTGSDIIAYCEGISRVARAVARRVAALPPDDRARVATHPAGDERPLEYWRDPFRGAVGHVLETCVEIASPLSLEIARLSDVLLRHIARFECSVYLRERKTHEKYGPGTFAVPYVTDAGEGEVVEVLMF